MAEKERINVLLIEDSPTDTQLIQGLLHDTQHECITLITASTLSKGLDELSQEAFDIILLDLGLPDSQGLETFRAIRAQAPHLAVIVLTITDDEELGRRAVQEGAQRFLSKDALKLGGLQSSMVTSALSDAIAHKQAKSALKASKEDFRALFELSPIAKIRYDADGYPTELNNAALALVGVTEVGAIRHISLFSTPRISEAEKERLRNGEAIRYEQQYDFDEIKKAGHFPTSSSGVSYLDAHVSPLFTEAGVVEAYIGEFVDITERKHAEVELASIAKFPEENPSPVLRLAHDGTVLYRNAPGEFSLNNVLFPFDEVRQQAAQAYAAAKVLTFEVTDESHVYKLTLVPIVNEHYINVYATDITERSRAEQALVEERDLAQRYLNLINLAHDAIIIRDLDHHALAWNKGAERLFGWTAAEAVGKRVPDLIKAVFPLSFERFQKKLLKEGHWEGTVRCEARDETPLIVEHSFTVEYDDSGAPAQLLSISYDITGHRQADEALLQAHGEMQKLNEELRIANEVLEQRVQERTEKLTRELAVTETITRLTPPLLFPLLDLDGLMLAILEDAKRLTGSAHGFIALIDPHTKELIAYGHTHMMLKECAIPDALRQVRFPVGPNGHYYGLWGHALNQREGFFTNAPAEHPAAAGTPQGHTLLEQVLVVPALITDEVVGEITLANPGRDYTKEDLVVVARLAEELFSLAVMRIRTEEQLNEASFYARNLIEASPDPLVTISAKGTITDANKAAEGVIGHSRDELIGSDFSNYFTEPELARRGYQQVFANGFVKDYPLAIQHKSGSITEVLYNATVYRDEAGKVQGVFAAARDITELKRAQRELERYSGHLEALVDERTSRLAQSEEDFRALFETSAVGQIRYDIDGRPIRMNSAITALLGIQDVADLQQITIFSSPRVSEEDKARLRAGYPTHYEQVYDFRMITKAGHFPTTRSDVRYFDIYMLPIFSTSGETFEGYLAQYVDITERKKAEAALKDAERLAGIGETAAMIGHDLRNPLQGLQYIVDLQKLRFERVPPEKRTAQDWELESQLFDRVSEQIFYMDKVVGDLQDYARPIGIEPETVALKTLINDVLTALPNADHVEIIVNAGDLKVNVDPHLVHRAFSNLILNALQAMPQGGTLTIDASASDHAVVINIHDTGIGIPEEIKDKLFSPLITGKAKGTGLGLSVVQRIVEAHKGTINFESKQGHGTTFTMTLPIT